MKEEHREDRLDGESPGRSLAVPLHGTGAQPEEGEGLRVSPAAS